MAELCSMVRVVFPGWIPAALLCACPLAGFSWEPGYPAAGERIATRDLSVHTGNRDDVVAFWHAVYEASEGYENRVGWTGSFPNKPGTTSAAFVGDVERRINFFRAMSGLPAAARVNTGSRVLISKSDKFKPAANVTKVDACQRAALMIVASYNATTGMVPGMSHDPAPGLALWNAATWNAAAKSNLSFGSYGPGAIDEYAIEELLASAATSEWNSRVGHRRWILATNATDFASGDYPGESVTRPPANVMYVFQRDEEMSQPDHPSFVSYPPAGYFPAMLNGRFWSLSHQNADFSSATVNVTDAAGKNVPVVSIWRDASFGDPAIIWQVDGAAAARTLAVDRRYRVTVQGIKGDTVPGTWEYDVTFIHPNALRRLSPISGVSTAKPSTKVKFKIKPMVGARKTRITEYERVNQEWVEGGEGDQPDVVDRTSPIYPLLATSAGQKGAKAISGTKSFNLTFPQAYDLVARGVPEQIMELGPWVYTGNNSELTFLFRRGLMTDASSLAVEISRDQGVSWTQTGATIQGQAGAIPDTKTISARYKLPVSSKPLRIRFRYFYVGNSGGISTHVDFPGFPTGIFLDDIRLLQCDRLLVRKKRETDNSAFLFQVPASAKPGNVWAFGMESEFGGPWLQTGPFRTLKVVK